MNANDPSTYQSYLLRLWRDHPGTPWQASLQSTATEKIYQFPSIEQLLAFLLVQVEMNSSEGSVLGDAKLADLKNRYHYFTKGADHMSEERVARVQRMALEIFGKGNLEAMDELYDPQVIRHNPPYPDANGLPTYKEFNKGILNAWSDIQLNFHEIIFAGDTSAARFTLEMTHTGETPQSHIPPTGKRVTQDGCVIAHWRGDRIVEEWLYADLMGLLQQLGVIPALTGAGK